MEPLRSEKEALVVTEMIQMYCRKHHADAQRDARELCADCAELADYACARIQACPHGEGKPFCVSCTIHCYKPDMRDRIRVVMRYAGPRMLLHHPAHAIWHIRESRKTSR